MSADSTIEWTDATWNPTRGCDKISPGCKHCYAETFAERWRGIPGHAYEQGFNLRLVPSAIELPLRWRKPRTIFVNSMSDLFHKDVPDEFIDQVFGAMAVTRRHTYQVLTKRADRLAEYLCSTDRRARVMEAATRWVGHRGVDACGLIWPLPNAWIGVSVENQECAEERIPHLIKVPAVVRFLSVEPMLGPVRLDVPRPGPDLDNGRICQPWFIQSGIDWVIVGGESGPGARPFALEWARSIVAQCKSASVACFVKQAGAQPVKALDGVVYRIHYADKKGGNPEEWPPDLRVREFPVTTQFRASEGGDGRAAAQGDAT